MASRRFRAIIVAAAVASITGTPAACEAQRDTIDVLFVGNSYVYVNNLPALVNGIAYALDGPIVWSVAHAHGGQTLRGHLDDMHLPGILSDGPSDGGGWDWVLMQEQSTLGAPYDRETGVLGSPDEFHRAARELTSLIRAEGATPVFYMTWAKESFPEQAETLSRAYRSIGTELDALVAPVGDAFAAVRRARPELSLYLGDGSHPNPAGSYLAACVIYAVLTGRSPLGAPRELSGAPWHNEGIVESTPPTVLVSLPAADASFLQRVAWDVVSERIEDGS